MNCINIKQLNLSNEMRMLWEQHVYWTRLLIISILNNLKDLKETEKRLLRNPVDMGRVYGRFYGPVVQREVTKLITEHLEIGGQLITASKNNNKEEFNINLLKICFIVAYFIFYHYPFSYCLHNVLLFE